jgi:predicted house-cleaning NTP pyrophosphatase (Maf/HAM1 superfamily)
MIDESSARLPVKEYTEFIEKPAVREATQTQTEYIHQHVQEQPIKLKEQPIQMVEQNTVIKQQPVIHRTQEVQVQQEKPIEVVKKNVTHETLPAMEEKEMVVQPVRSSDTQTKTINRSSNEGCTSTNVQVTAPSREAEAIGSLSLDEKAGHHNIIEKVKEKVGGAKQAAHGAIETAREKAREVFSGHSKDDTMMGSSTQTSTSYQQTTNTGASGTQGTGYSH